MSHAANLSRIRASGRAIRARPDRRGGGCAGRPSFSAHLATHLSPGARILTRLDDQSSLRSAYARPPRRASTSGYGLLAAGPIDLQEALIDGRLLFVVETLVVFHSVDQERQVVVAELQPFAVDFAWRWVRQ